MGCTGPSPLPKWDQSPQPQQSPEGAAEGEQVESSKSRPAVSLECPVSSSLFWQLRSELTHSPCPATV